MVDNNTINFNQVQKAGTFGNVVDLINANFNLAKEAILMMKGKSAYEIWREQEGNENKTVKEFLASLKESGFETEAVQSLPTTNIDTKTIYAVPVDSESWAEKIYSNGSWITLAIHNESGLSSVISDVDDLKQRNEPIVFTDNKSYNAFIKTIFIDINGAGVIDCWVRASASQINIYDESNSSSPILTVAINANDSVYCGRNNLGIYYYIEIDRVKYPSTSLSVAKLTSWAMSESYDPRKNTDGMTESPLLNKYIKEMWVEFKDEFVGDKDTIINKLYVYSLSSELNEEVGNDNYGKYYNRLAVRILDSDYLSHYFIYGKYNDNASFTIRESSNSNIILHCKIDWEGLKGTVFSGGINTYIKLMPKCYQPSFFDVGEQIVFSNNVGTETNVAFTPKGAKELKEDLELKIEESSTHKYTEDSTLNKLFKKLYIDLSGYCGDKGFKNMSQISISAYCALPRSSGGYAWQIALKDIQENIILWGKVYLSEPTVISEVLNGVFVYAECDWSNMNANQTISNKKVNNDSFIKPDFVSEDYLLRETDLAIASKMTSYSVTAERYSNLLPRVFSILSNPSRNIPRIYVVDNPNISEEEYVENGVTKTRAKLNTKRIRYMVDGSSELQTSTLADGEVLRLKEIDDIPEINSDIKVSLDKVHALVLNESDIYEPVDNDVVNGIANSLGVIKPIDGVEVVSIVVDNQDDFDDLQENLIAAMQDSSVTDIRIYMKSGIYKTSGVNDENGRTSTPHLSLIPYKDGNNITRRWGRQEGDIRKNISINGEKGTIVIVGDTTYSVDDENAVDLGEYVGVPYDGTISHNHTFVKENGEPVNVINVNDFMFATSGVSTVDSSLHRYRIDVPYIGYTYNKAQEGGEPMILITAGWMALNCAVYRIDVLDSTNTLPQRSRIYFEYVDNADYEQYLNYDYGTYHNHARWKLYNERLRPNSITIRDGYIYIPKDFGSVVECEYDRFFAITNSTLGIVEISNVDFRGGAYLNDSSSMFYLQDANCTKFTIKNCRFEGVGVRILDCRYYSHNVEFKDNVVKDCITANAVKSNRGCYNFVVTNNLFKNNNLGFFKNPIVCAQGLTSYIADNVFENNPYICIETGLWYDSNPSYTPYNPSGFGTKAIIERNECYFTEDYYRNKHQHVSMDGAQLYFFSRNANIIVRHNYIHDISGYSDRYCGIYLDGSAENIAVYGNLILNVCGSSIYSYSWNDRAAENSIVYGIKTLKQDKVGNTYANVEVQAYITGNTGCAVVGNIVDYDILFQGNPHVDGVDGVDGFVKEPAFWDGDTCLVNKTIVGANILLDRRYKITVNDLYTDKYIMIDGVGYNLPNLHVQAVEINRGEVYLLDGLRDAIRELPFDKFILQHIHRANTRKKIEDN